MTTLRQKQNRRPKSSARSYALWLLSRRAYSSQALLQRLRGRGYAAEEAQDAVLYLQEVGYVNDEVYAHDFVNWRSQAGNGPRKLRYELKGKGIGEDEIEGALASLDDEELKQQAMVVARRKLRGRDLGDDKVRLSVMRFLLQRGYGYELVEEVVAKLLACLDSEEQNS